jgi:hypothetical protein
VSAAGSSALTLRSTSRRPTWSLRTGVRRRDADRAEWVRWGRGIWFGGASGGGGGSSGKCTPGYSPCLPDHGGGDYDCYGGGGIGPYYTQPGVTYTVTLPAAWQRRRQGVRVAGHVVAGGDFTPVHETHQARYVEYSGRHAMVAGLRKRRQNVPQLHVRARPPEVGLPAWPV